MAVIDVQGTFDFSRLTQPISHGNGTLHGGSQAASKEVVCGGRKDTNPYSFKDEVAADCCCVRDLEAKLDPNASDSLSRPCCPSPVIFPTTLAPWGIGSPAMVTEESIDLLNDVELSTRLVAVPGWT